MSILIYYWSDGPHAQAFTSEQFSEALKFAEQKRKCVGVSHVCISSEHPNSVGKAGVAEVGPDYEWSKQHRGNHGTIERVKKE